MLILYSIKYHIIIYGVRQHLGIQQISAFSYAPCCFGHVEERKLVPLLDNTAKGGFDGVLRQLGNAK